METGLAGKTVIVTGGNANIGRGIVLAFAREGANVVIAARDEQQGRGVAAVAMELGAQDVLWARTDVLNSGEVESMVNQTLERFGSIDVLINNVGGNVDFKTFVESTEEEWKKEIDLNLWSTLRCTKAVLPHMIAQKSGKIINLGSTTGFVGDPLLVVYSAMKGAIHAFTKVLAKEVGPYGINVNAVSPYATAPENLDEETSEGSRWHPSKDLIIKAIATKPDDLLTMSRQCALERTSAKPSEIGAAAVYLASEAAAFTTGHLLVVDGGTLLM
ncbi:MAG: SDR family oxidoreductase [Chloroflexi bacterium]|nr:SDR family oxidoreductase [Chloroflexota bacterium]